MSDNSHTEQHARAGYETKDVQLRTVLYLAAAVTALIVCTQAGLWYWFEIGDGETATRSEAPADEQQIPPDPRLQSAPIHDYQVFLAEQEARLSSYGWVDRRDGIVHLPIERAIELVLERGLPAPAPQEQPATDEPTPPAEEKQP